MLEGRSPGSGSGAAPWNKKQQSRCKKAQMEVEVDVRRGKESKAGKRMDRASTRKGRQARVESGNRQGETLGGYPGKLGIQEANFALLPAVKVW